MYGAIAGDIAGSLYEFNNIKTTNFKLFEKGSNYTDDSILTIAVADWILSDKKLTHTCLIQKLQEYGHTYNCPMGGFGGGFSCWLNSSNPLPYNSWGNGSAMRASAVGWAFDTLERTMEVAKISAEVTHNHPEGIKGAQATAAAIFLARNGKTKKEIQQYITTAFGYDLNRTCDEIRPTYTFNESCQETVPEAIIVFLESKDFEELLHLGVSLGGDSDTLTCIAGGIGEAFYGGIPSFVTKIIHERLDPHLAEIEQNFYAEYVTNKL